ELLSAQLKMPSSEPEQFTAFTVRLVPWCQMHACTPSSPLIFTWLMTALAPSSTLMAPVPLASSPVLPLFATTTLFSMVMFGASMSSIPWTLSQLITVLGLVTGMVRVMLPPSSVSWPPGHCDRLGPVLVGPGQPQAARLAHSSGPPAVGRRRGRARLGRGHRRGGYGAARR